MFAIDAERDIDFLRKVLHVRRQVKIIRGKQVFAPIKNDKVHDVPLTDDDVVMLSEPGYAPQGSQRPLAGCAKPSGHSR